MCNANNFISSVQTSGIRIRSTGYSFKKALETKKIKTKICWHHFYLKGKKATYVFFVLIIRFREFGDENNTVIFQIISKFEQPNHLKHEKTKKKTNIFSLYPPDTPRIQIRSARWFLPGSGSAKNADPKLCLLCRWGRQTVQQYSNSLDVITQDGKIIWGGKEIMIRRGKHEHLIYA